MMPGHKVSGTRRRASLDEKLAVGADALKAVMLDCHRFTRDPRQHER
jgi:hypothetical protein